MPTRKFHAIAICLLFIAVIFICSHYGLRQDPLARAQPPDGQEPSDATAMVRVSVHLPGGRHFDGEASVQLQRGTEVLSLQRKMGVPLFEGTVPSGSYAVVVKAQDWDAPHQTIDVPATGITLSVYLGKKDWPTYRLGTSIVPFEPREELLAVAFETSPPSRRVARRVVDQLKKQLPIDEFALDESKPLPFTAADGAIWILKLRNASPEARANVSSEIRQQLAEIGHREGVRIGLPVDLIPNQVKVLDNHFVVRFRDHLTPDNIDALIEEAGATILRSFIQAGNARLIRFERGTYRDHLRIVESWRRQNLLLYGEPDLMAEITDDVFPDDPPNDPTYTSQANLTLQDADDAWQYIDDFVSSTFMLGNPAVYVATLDRGVDTDHPDIGDSLSDGAPQLARCYDFSGLQACTVPGYAPDTDHGMGVYGIIAARTNNGCVPVLQCRKPLVFVGLTVC